MISLKEILRGIKINSFTGDKEKLICGLTDDSREVKKRYLFVAIKGKNFDGNKYIDQAIKNGAVAIVSEFSCPKGLPLSVCYIKVANARQTLSLLASNWYKNPSKNLKIIGITGTDGKTTTANILYWIILQSGKRVGIVSTVGAKIDKKTYDTGLHVTNPEPLKLQELLAKMAKKGCHYVVLEVTSHGLDQGRVFGIPFEIGILTNVTHEHLDYHKTFEEYLRAKANLFLASRQVLLNKDDSSFDKVKALLPKDIRLNFYSKNSPSKTVNAAIKRRFPELYNRYNASAAVSAAKMLGIGAADIISALKTFPFVSGRMQEVKNQRGINIFIDFAHTPNALENLLKTLSEKERGKVICVFGSAGERDISKRPLMGAISARYAQVSVITAEDPRFENVDKIISQIEKGVKTVSNAKYYKIPERGEAISFAINKLAKKGDTVVVCGKGHEKSMCYQAKEYPWSDQKAIGYALKKKTLRIKHE